MKIYGFVYEDSYYCLDDTPLCCCANTMGEAYANLRRYGQSRDLLTEITFKTLDGKVLEPILSDVNYVLQDDMLVGLVVNNNIIIKDIWPAVAYLSSNDYYWTSFKDFGFVRSYVERNMQPINIFKKDTILKPYLLTR